MTGASMHAGKWIHDPAHDAGVSVFRHLCHAYHVQPFQSSVKNLIQRKADGAGIGRAGGQSGAHGQIAAHHHVEAGGFDPPLPEARQDAQCIVRPAQERSAFICHQPFMHTRKIH